MLNTKQVRFCEEYIACGNATESAKKAGYSDKTAYSQGQRLLKHVEIKKRIDDLNAEIDNSKIASAKEIQQFLTSQMRGEAKEECVAVVSSGDFCSEAILIKKEITPKDRQKAADTLAKIKQLYSEAPQQPITIVFSDDYGDDDGNAAS